MGKVEEVLRASQAELRLSKCVFNKINLSYQSGCFDSIKEKCGSISREANELLTKRMADYRVRAVLVAISAISWAGFAYMYSFGFSFVREAPGVHLLYLPAGVRLLLLLLFGVWGAIGIAIAHPIVVWTQFGSSSLAFTIAHSVISGFGGLLVVNASRRLLGVSSDLSGLRGIHLPLLSLLMAIVMPILFGADLIAFDIRTPTDVVSTYWATLLGDFLGCFSVMAFVLLLVRAFRTRLSKTNSRR